MTRTASDRLPRWLCPPPARTAAFSSARSPGVVLRVSRTRVAGLAAAHGVDEAPGQGGHARQVAEEVEGGALGGEDRPQRSPTVATTSPAADRRPVGPVASRHGDRRVDLGEGLDGAGPAGQHTPCRG